MIVGVNLVIVVGKGKTIVTKESTKKGSLFLCGKI